MPQSSLLVPRAILSQVLARAQEALPEEACGLLGGLEGRVFAHYPGTNIALSPVRYEMDPRQVVEAIQDMLERGWDLVAVYHSHPSGPSGLSHTDLELAYYPESAYLVASPGPVGDWHLRAFHLDESGAVEVEIRVEE